MQHIFFIYENAFENIVRKMAPILSRFQCLKLLNVILPGMVQPDEPEISPEIRLEWIRCYLEAKYTHFGKDPADIPEVLVAFNDVEHAIIEAVRKFDWIQSYF